MPNGYTPPAGGPTDTLGWVQMQVEAVLAYIDQSIAGVWSYISTVYFSALGWVNAVWDFLKGVLGTIWKGLRLLARLRFAEIWQAIKRVIDRVYRALVWYQKHVLAPLDRMRRQIWAIYNQFFRPLIRFLDSLRVFVRMIALFNRKLAAALDRRLFTLEAKLMAPITAALRRINSLSSYTRALITAKGLLDRTLLLESMRRDALLVWEVLTNPRARLFEPVAKPAPYDASHEAADFVDFCVSDSGPYVAAADEAQATVREVLAVG